MDYVESFLAKRSSLKKKLDEIRSRGHYEHQQELRERTREPSLRYSIRFTPDSEEKLRRMDGDHVASKEEMGERKAAGESANLGRHLERAFSAIKQGRRDSKLLGA